MMREEKITTSPSSRLCSGDLAGDPRQGGARLALLAGADQQDLVART